MVKIFKRYGFGSLKDSCIRSGVIRRRISLFLLFCTMAVNMQANPFTGNKNAPAPVRTDQTPEFIAGRQAQLHTKLGDAIYEWTQTHSMHTLLAIIGIAFFYGVMHALGPGHRKTLVFSFYLSKKAPVWEPAVTSLILAGLHGLTSAALLLIFRNVNGALSGATNSAAIYLEGFSFILLLLLSLASILHLLSDAFPGRFPHIHLGCGRTTRFKRIPQTETTAGYNFSRYRNYHKQYRTVEKMQWSTFLLSGLYPCPAALLVLVLVSALDAAGVGIIAVISMSAGMALPITATAYLAWTGRKRLFKRIGKTQKYVETAALLFSLAAYGAIFIFSLIAVIPFIKSLGRL